MLFSYTTCHHQNKEQSLGNYRNKRKKSLYILSKTSNSPKIKAYYTQYCIISRKIIRKVEQMYYNDLLTSWSIIKSETGNANSKHHTLEGFKLGNKIICINQTSEEINNYFFQFS